MRNGAACRCTHSSCLVHKLLTPNNRPGKISGVMGKLHLHFAGRPKQQHGGATMHMRTLSPEAVFNPEAFLHILRALQPANALPGPHGLAGVWVPLPHMFETG